MFKSACDGEKRDDDARWPVSATSEGGIAAVVHYNTHAAAEDANTSIALSALRITHAADTTRAASAFLALCLCHRRCPPSPVHTFPHPVPSTGPSRAFEIPLYYTARTRTSDRSGFVVRVRVVVGGSGGGGNGYRLFGIIPRWAGGTDRDAHLLHRRSSVLSAGRRVRVKRILYT